jgi:hypothetical protein
MEACKSALHEEWGKLRAVTSTIEVKIAALKAECEAARVSAKAPLAALTLRAEAKRADLSAYKLMDTVQAMRRVLRANPKTVFLFTLDELAWDAKTGEFLDADPGESAPFKEGVRMLQRGFRVVAPAELRRTYQARACCIERVKEDQPDPFLTASRASFCGEVKEDLTGWEIDEATACEIDDDAWTEKFYDEDDLADCDITCIEQTYVSKPGAYAFLIPRT